MPRAFDYRQAEEIREVFARHNIRHLFIGKSAAILLGFPDTTQDADLFVEKTLANCATMRGGCCAAYQLRDHDRRHDRRAAGKRFFEELRVSAALGVNRVHPQAE